MLGVLLWWPQLLQAGSLNALCAGTVARLCWRSCIYKPLDIVMQNACQTAYLTLCSFPSVLPGMALQEHAGSEKSWVWHAADFADGELKDELFAIRFGSVESK